MNMWKSRLVQLSLLAVLQRTSASAVAAPPRDWDVRGGGGHNRVAAAAVSSVQESRMPSLFPPDESQFDKYAACLAATEGLRKIRDRSLEQEGKQKKKKDSELTETEKQIMAEYAHNSAQVLQALGMSITQFNSLGRQINENSNLKEKVMEQAYLYRMAATLHLERIPIVEDPASKQLLKTDRRKRVELFCDSMVEIEQLRVDQMERLKKALRVKQLPPNFSLTDPNVLPFLNPKVKAVVEAFPLQAEEIVRKHGMDSDEFNEMLELTKSNSGFRRQVEQEMGKEEANKGKISSN